MTITMAMAVPANTATTPHFPSRALDNRQSRHVNGCVELAEAAFEFVPAPHSKCYRCGPSTLRRTTVCLLYEITHKTHNSGRLQGILTGAQEHQKRPSGAAHIPSTC